MELITLHPRYDPMSQPTKFCKNCIFNNYVLNAIGDKKYECHNENNLNGISPVDGSRVVIHSAGILRTTDELCGMDAKWFVERAEPQGYESLGYIPNGGSVVRGETSQERLERLRNKAIQSSRPKALNKITVEDL